MGEEDKSTLSEEAETKSLKIPKDLMFRVRDAFFKKNPVLPDRLADTSVVIAILNSYVSD